MDASDFKFWRQAMGFTQDQAAAALGISKASVVNYEAGKRYEDGRPVIIPKTVALACTTVACNLREWPLMDSTLIAKVQDAAS